MSIFDHVVAMTRQTDGHRLSDSIEGLDDIIAIQTSEPSNKTDDYMRGLSNGLLTAKAIVTDDQEPVKLMGPDGNMDEALDPKKLGRCYQLSGSFVLNNPGWTLVHGTVSNSKANAGKPNPHAWAEKIEQNGRWVNITVFDPVMDVELPWDAYERFMGAKINKKYTHEEMISAATKKKPMHWGPWESVNEDSEINVLGLKFSKSEVDAAIKLKRDPESRDYFHIERNGRKFVIRRAYDNNERHAGWDVFDVTSGKDVGDDTWMDRYSQLYVAKCLIYHWTKKKNESLGDVIGIDGYRKKPRERRINEEVVLHKFSNTQIAAPHDIAQSVIEFGLSIPDEDIYTDPDDTSMGRELQPHVTIKWGLITEDPEQVESLIEDSQGEFEVALGSVSLFSKENVPYDVVKIDVEGEGLHRLHELFSTLENGDENPEYVPHMTIAYVKKGTGAKYEGNDVFKGVTFKVDGFEFRDQHGNSTQLMLNNTKEEI